MECRSYNLPGNARQYLHVGKQSDRGRQSGKEEGGVIKKGHLNTC